MKPKAFVVDASVMVKWIRTEREASLEQAEKLLKDLQENTVMLYAPELAKYEIGNALVKRKLTPEQAHKSLEVLYSIPVCFIPETAAFATMTYKLANELGITHYDAAYLTLGKEFKCTVITENIKHLGRAKAISVMSLANYPL